MAALRALLELSSNSNVYRNCRSSGRYFVPVKWKSTTAAAVETSVSRTESTPQHLEPPPRDPLDMSFTDAKAAYKSKTTWELIRAFVVLKLTSSNYVVNNQERLMAFGQKVLGKRLFRLLMRHTFYGHFVGGESETAIQPLIKRLRSFGVKSILDYSAEEDLSAEEAKEVEMASCVSAAAQDVEGETADHLKQFQPTEEFADRRYPQVMVRTYFYLNEAHCEKNMATFLKCIDAVSGATKATGLAAIKLTALGRPQLLMQLSEVVAHTRKYFQDVTGADRAMALMEVTPTSLEKKLNVSNEHKDAFQTWLQRMDYDRKG